MTKPARAAEKINVGGSIALLWAPLYIASKHKLFSKYGLDVDVLPFASGRATQEAVVGGSVTWGTVPETPAMFAFTNNLPVRVIGSMTAYELLDMVSTTDIRKVEDLKGKRVGIARGATPDYVLAAALQKVGMKITDVNAINLTPTDMVTSIVNNQIDAFLWTEPHTSQAVKLGGGKFHSVHLAGISTTYASIVALQSTIDSTPDVLVKSICALKDATQYMKDNKEASISFVADHIKMDRATVAKEWERIPFEITLNKPEYVGEVKRQAQWALGSGLVPPSTKLPDYDKLVTTSIFDKAQNCNPGK